MRQLSFFVGTTLAAILYSPYHVNAQSVWALGTNMVGDHGDYGVYAWNGQGWVGEANAGGVKIAASGSEVWLINSKNEFWRRSSPGAWNHIQSGLGRHIAIAAETPGGRPRQRADK